MGRLKTLKTCPAFRDLSAADLAWLAASVDLKTYQQEDTVFKEGSVEAGAYIILDGEVGVSSSSAPGNSREVLLGAGEMLGNSGVLGESRRLTTATVRSTSATLVYLPAEGAQRLLQGNPAVAHRILSSLQQSLLARARACIPHDSA